MLQFLEIDVIKKEAGKILKYKDLNINSAHPMECESKTDTRNNRGEWNHFKITQTIPEPHTRKAQNKGTAKNSLTGHSTHTTECANVKAQNIFRGRNNITCSTNCEYRTLATLHTLETWFVSGT